jgi:predicted Zn-dependent peptidase
MKRGLVAAVLSALIVAGQQGPAARASAPSSDLAPGEMLLAGGLTMASRRVSSSPTAALQVWVRCPSDGYGAPRPGIARLTAMALVSRKVRGSSLRDEVRTHGGEITVSVFPTASEISVEVPAYVAPPLASSLVDAVRRPRLERQAFDEAKLFLAAQQVQSTALADLSLRDALFAQLFTSGPFHYSTYGDVKTLRTLSLAEAQSFAAAAYVPGNELIVGVGDVDSRDFARRAAALALQAASAPPIPHSARAQYPRTAVQLGAAGPPGLALGWFGPPINDQRAATAMDFLSDYLTRPHYGLIAKAVEAQLPDAAFNGQFITLQDAGVFYFSVAGAQVDASALSAKAQPALDAVRKAPLADAQFAQAIDAFITHMLRDTQTPRQLADNFGWYFTQGAAAYTPSAAGSALKGLYYQQAVALTPQFVYQTAQKYLSAAPAVVIVGSPGAGHRR